MPGRASADWTEAILMIRPLPRLIIARAIRAEQSLEHFGGIILKRGAELHSGIVDQAVDRTCFFKHAHGGLHRLGIGHVEGSGFHGQPLATQRLGRFVQPLGIARIQHDRSPVFAKPPRQSLADSHAGTGDQDAPPAQVEKCTSHVVFLSLNSEATLGFRVTNH